MKTYSTKMSEVRRTWHVLDAANKPLGRLASEAASLIRGKHKVTYTPHLDTGDYVVIVNAEQVVLTGRKPEQKVYHWHTQYPGGLKTRSVRQQMDRNPARVVERAVFGMLPHNKLGNSLHGHLKVYVGPDHPHAAQVNGPAQPALSQAPPEGRRKPKPATARAAAPVASRRVAMPVAPQTKAEEDIVGPEPAGSVDVAPITLEEAENEALAEAAAERAAESEAPAESAETVEEAGEKPEENQA
jgi:large subunit ribosomal protein L13